MSGIVEFFSGLRNLPSDLVEKVGNAIGNIIKEFNDTLVNTYQSFSGQTHESNMRQLTDAHTQAMTRLENHQRTQLAQSNIQAENARLRYQLQIAKEYIEYIKSEARRHLYEEFFSVVHGAIDAGRGGRFICRVGDVELEINLQPQLSPRLISSQERTSTIIFCLYWDSNNLARPREIYVADTLSGWNRSTPQDKMTLLPDKDNTFCLVKKVPANQQRYEFKYTYREQENSNTLWLPVGAPNLGHNNFMPNTIYAVISFKCSIPVDQIGFAHDGRSSENCHNLRRSEGQDNHDVYTKILPTNFDLFRFFKQAPRQTEKQWFPHPTEVGINNPHANISIQDILRGTSRIDVRSLSEANRDNLHNSISQFPFGQPFQPQPRRQPLLRGEENSDDLRMAQQLSLDSLPLQEQAHRIVVQEINDEQLQRGIFNSSGRRP